MAAVELINILRPTVAVAWPGTFAALALAQHPEWRSRLADEAADHERARRAFGHEVRRTAPFVPARAGRIRADAVVGGIRLRPGDRIVLDVPGTHRDAAAWRDPEAFDPERFAGGDPDPFVFVPQGGGDTETGHRCPASRSPSDCSPKPWARSPGSTTRWSPPRRPTWAGSRPCRRAAW